MDSKSPAGKPGGISKTTPCGKCTLQLPLPARAIRGISQKQGPGPVGSLSARFSQFRSEATLTPARLAKSFCVSPLA